MTESKELAALRAWMRQRSSALVCFSGGVDSALVLAVAHRELGASALGMTAVSASLPEGERAEVESVARQLGVAHVFVDSAEVEDPRYAANPTNRCYYCKSELYRIARREAASRGIAAILNGTNVEDLGDWRPGLDAAREAEVSSPLVELGFDKAMVRAVARELGLQVWDKPAAACLSSRIPYGTSVTPERLAQVGRAEAALRKLGLRQLRVRYHGEVARIEVGPAELERAFEMRAQLAAAVRQAGFTYATLDLEGYRQGSHNEVVRLPVLTR